MSPSTLAMLWPEDDFGGAGAGDGLVVYCSGQQSASLGPGDADGLDWRYVDMLNAFPCLKVCIDLCCCSRFEMSVLTAAWEVE